MLYDCKRVFCYFQQEYLKYFCGEDFTFTLTSVSISGTLAVNI